MTTAAMVSYRRSTPPNEILCGDFQAKFKSPALQCQTCKISYHSTCAKMPLYFMVRHSSSSVSFVCKQCTIKSAESHRTETVLQFKDCYPNLNDIENPPGKNETDMRVETESISHTSRESREASRQNIEDSPNTQDQDIVQEQIQERMEPKNEINISKFYIKKCCKHDNGVTTAIIHTLLHAKNILKTPNLMRTRMRQLPPRYLQIFYVIQKVLKREILQNSP